MHITVNTIVRNARCRAHTATHLLHLSLSAILGSTKQEGSRVGEDSLRFDFAADRFLTVDEILSLEKNLADIIRADYQVFCDEMSYREAIDLGAKAFFTDKYGDRVRVVRIDNTASIELCGGTHVKTTGQIGGFVITNQESVSAGIKRISAVCGPEVAVAARDFAHQLDNVCHTLSLSSHAQIADKMKKMITDLDESTRQLEVLRASMSVHILSSLPRIQKDAFVVYEITKQHPWASWETKDIVSSLKNHQSAKPFLIYDVGGFFVIGGTSEISAKIIQQKLGLKGGGSDSLIQGKDQTIKSKV